MHVIIEELLKLKPGRLQDKVLAEVMRTLKLVLFGKSTV